MFDPINLMSQASEYANEILLVVTFLMFAVFLTMAGKLVELARSTMDERDTPKQTKNPFLLEIEYPWINAVVVGGMLAVSCSIAQLALQANNLSAIPAMLVGFLLSIAYLVFRLSRIQVIRMDQYALHKVRLPSRNKA